ncbi:MAG: hypothetical protein ACK56I_02395, partial [bacterium]
ARALARRRPGADPLRHDAYAAPLRHDAHGPAHTGRVHDHARNAGDALVAPGDRAQLGLGVRRRARRDHGPQRPPRGPERRAHGPDRDARGPEEPRRRVAPHEHRRGTRQARLLRAG